MKNARVPLPPGAAHDPWKEHTKPNQDFDDRTHAWTVPPMQAPAADASTGTAHGQTTSTSRLH